MNDVESKLVDLKNQTLRDSKNGIKWWNIKSGAVEFFCFTSKSDSVILGIFNRIVFCLQSSLLIDPFKSVFFLTFSKDISELSGDEIWLSFIVWTDVLWFIALDEFSGTITVINGSDMFEVLRLNFGHFWWWWRIRFGDRVNVSAVFGRRPSFRCCRWYLKVCFYDFFLLFGVVGYRLHNYFEKLCWKLLKNCEMI